MATWFTSFLYSQLVVSLPYPKQDFSGQTIIITGANTGLGFEAARHFARLNAAKVILAVRNLEKGEEAKRSIDLSTQRKSDVVEVWKLDLSKYASVQQFAERAQGLTRLDVVVENAGMESLKFSMTEDNETSITINVVSTFLLALLLLPKLRETATKFNVLPRLVVTSSDLHFIAQFPERKSKAIFAALNTEGTSNLRNRQGYPVNKLIQVLTVRTLASLITASQNPKIIINCLTPGACISEFGRERTGVAKFLMTIGFGLLARTTEVGSRSIIAAVDGGPETHGEYMADCHVSSPSPFVWSKEGFLSQERVWAELSSKLEAIHPGILKNI
ncbi:MAG: hypothetical protein M1827_006230 [Pycnora praestabilis]|nr:MAG: hypothetical protein M1827_006230 [Pycnora praestabilis]